MPPKSKSTLKNRKTNSSEIASKDENEDVAILEESSATRAKSADEVKKSESKLQKILIRTFYGALMVAIFFGLIYAGHLYVVLLVVLIQVYS